MIQSTITCDRCGKVLTPAASDGGSYTALSAGVEAGKSSKAATGLRLDVFAGNERLDLCSDCAVAVVSAMAKESQ